MTRICETYKQEKPLNHFHKKYKNYQKKYYKKHKYNSERKEGK